MKGRTYADPHARCSHNRYKMSCAEYDTLRDDTCACCLVPSRELVLDHDHTRGQWAVRGLVCRRCNGVLMMVDAGRWAPSERVIAYLARPWHAAHRVAGPQLFVATPRRRDLSPPLLDDVQEWADQRDERLGRR